MRLQGLFVEPCKIRDQCAYTADSRVQGVGRMVQAACTQKEVCGKKKSAASKVGILRGIILCVGSLCCLHTQILHLVGEFFIDVLQAQGCVQAARGMGLKAKGLAVWGKCFGIAEDFLNLRANEGRMPSKIWRMA